MSKNRNSLALSEQCMFEVDGDGVWWLSLPNTDIRLMVSPGGEQGVDFDSSRQEIIVTAHASVCLTIKGDLDQAQQLHQVIGGEWVAAKPK